MFFFISSKRSHYKLLENWKVPNDQIDTSIHTLIRAHSIKKYNQTRNSNEIISKKDTIHFYQFVPSLDCFFVVVVVSVANKHRKRVNRIHSWSADGFKSRTIKQFICKLFFSLLFNEYFFYSVERINRNRIIAWFALGLILQIQFINRIIKMFSLHTRRIG